MKFEGWQCAPMTQDVSHTFPPISALTSPPATSPLAPQALCPPPSGLSGPSPQVSSAWHHSPLPLGPSGPGSCPLLREACPDLLYHPHTSPDPSSHLISVCSTS